MLDHVFHERRLQILALLREVLERQTDHVHLSQRDIVIWIKVGEECKIDGRPIEECNIMSERE